MLIDFRDDFIVFLDFCKMNEQSQHATINKLAIMENVQYGQICEVHERKTPTKSIIRMLKPKRKR